jgi:hypothetical protein
MAQSTLLKNLVTCLMYLPSSLGSLKDCRVHLINFLNVPVDLEKMPLLLTGHSGSEMGMVLKAVPRLL